MSDSNPDSSKEPKTTSMTTEAELASTQRERDNLKETLQSERITHETQLNADKEKISTLERELNSLSAALTTTQAELASTQCERDKLQETLLVNKDTISTLEREVSSLSQKIADRDEVVALHASSNPTQPASSSPPAVPVVNSIGSSTNAAMPLTAAEASNPSDTGDEAGYQSSSTTKPPAASSSTALPIANYIDRSTNTATPMSAADVSDPTSTTKDYASRQLSPPSDANPAPADPINTVTITPFNTAAATEATRVDTTNTNIVTTVDSAPPTNPSSESSPRIKLEGSKENASSIPSTQPLAHSSTSTTTPSQIASGTGEMAMAPELEEAKKTAADDVIGKELLGKVFLVDEREVGNMSLHFDNEVGPFISYAHKDYDRSKFPLRMLFSKCSFNSHQREFSGVLDFSSFRIGKNKSATYVMVFDTKFLCVVSGTVVYKKLDGTETMRKFGVDRCFTNLCLDNVDEDNTVTRLLVEGASAKTIASFQKNLASFQNHLHFTEDEELTVRRRQVAAKYTADGKTFGELDEGFVYSTKLEYHGGKYKFGKEKMHFMDMSRPKPCSRRRWNDDIKKYEKIILSQSEGYDPSTPPPVEQRGITLTQLRAVEANIMRRCEKEGWVNYKHEKLTPDTVTLYDVDSYIIRPYTKSRQLSLVSCLPSTAGEQPPVFFISHWWGEPVRDFIRCLERVVHDFSINRNEEDERRGGGITEDTPFWICAYGNNQWSLSTDITVDPRDSGFSRAMEVAEGRTISILDTEGVVFTRIWCSFELFLTLVKEKGKGKEEAKKKGMWAVYTACRRKDKYFGTDAVGIVSGGALIDLGNPNHTINRESDFPFKLIKGCLKISVETAEASEPSDKVHILNSICGRTGDALTDKPPTNHSSYEKVNDSIKAAFASSVPTLRAASKEDEETWGAFLEALSRGTAKLDMEFHFNLYGWEGVTTDRAAKMIAHLPTTTAKLTIWGAKFGSEFIDSVAKLVSQSSELDSLNICYSELDGGEEGGKAGGELADAMARNTSITDLELRDTDLVTGNNVERWEAALTTNTTLEKLWLYGVDGDIVKRLYIARRSSKLKYSKQ